MIRRGRLLLAIGSGPGAGFLLNKVAAPVMPRGWRGEGRSSSRSGWGLGNGEAVVGWVGRSLLYVDAVLAAVGWVLCDSLSHLSLSYSSC
jgi:hypothetical protein